ncbi:serpin-Z4-like [Nicotiana sylvestris]|uniref:Serpin-Z4-like n=1 Tax=Nicotiana sylvestris TaxID=4096 RepID=A0A1U7XME5_NICSY|nr:PREDICTED: serpin-Z4-like [Nicotiana sylvestris]
MTSEPEFLTRHLPSKTVDVRRLLIPKFKITFNFEASKVLKEVGLTHPFCGDGLAEIVDDTVPLSVSKVLHKSFIEVNEEGTKVAAVTAATMMYGCPAMMIKEEPIDFVADHPFLFLVKDDVTGVILFIGTVESSRCLAYFGLVLFLYD